MRNNDDSDRIVYEGLVVESCKGLFRIKVTEVYEVLCTLSGKVRQNSVRILDGDKVRIEVSKYEPTKGRIVYRMSAGKQYS